MPLNAQLGRTIVSPAGALILIPGPCPCTIGRRSTAVSASVGSAQSLGTSLGSEAGERPRRRRTLGRDGHAEARHRDDEPQVLHGRSWSLRPFEHRHIAWRAHRRHRNRHRLASRAPHDIEDPRTGFVEGGIENAVRVVVRGHRRDARAGQAAVHMPGQARGAFPDVPDAVRRPVVGEIRDLIAVVIRRRGLDGLARAAPSPASARCRRSS